MAKAKTKSKKSPKHNMQVKVLSLSIPVAHCPSIKEDAGGEPYTRVEVYFNVQRGKKVAEFFSGNDNDGNSVHSSCLRIDNNMRDLDKGYNLISTTAGVSYFDSCRFERVSDYEDNMFDAIYDAEPKAFLAQWFTRPDQCDLLMITGLGGTKYAALPMANTTDFSGDEAAAFHFWFTRNNFVVNTFNGRAPNMLVFLGVLHSDIRRFRDRLAELKTILALKEPSKDVLAQIESIRKEINEYDALGSWLCEEGLALVVWTAMVELTVMASLGATTSMLEKYTAGLNRYHGNTLMEAVSKFDDEHRAVCNLLDKYHTRFSLEQETSAPVGVVAKLTEKVAERIYKNTNLDRARSADMASEIVRQVVAEAAPKKSEPKSKTSKPKGSK